MSRRKEHIPGQLALTDFKVVSKETGRNVSCKYRKEEEDKYKELDYEVKRIGYVDARGLLEDLKRRQDISSNMVGFLKCVSDMNNPYIEDVCEAIEQKLRNENIIV